MTIQVHDDLVFDAQKVEAVELEALVRENIEKAIELKVPALVDIGKGINWDEAH